MQHRNLSLWVGLALAACGSEDQGKAGLDLAFSGDAPDSHEVHESFSFVTLCDGLARTCCKLDQCELPGQLPPDCFEQTRKLCEDTVTGPLATHLDAGEVWFSPEAASECYTAFDEASCGDISVLTGAPPAACGEGFSGIVAAGASCAFDAVCAPGLFCKPAADGTCPGTCQPKKALGDACNAVDALCADDLLCAGGDASHDGACVPAKVALGEACVSVVQCPEGSAYCSKTTGKCEPRRQRGQACPEHTECAFAAGLVCAGEAGHEACAPVPALGEQCDGTCADGLICGFEQKTCAAQPKLGEPCIDPITGCGPFSGLQCDPGTQHCIARLALGAECGGMNGPTQCLGSYCDGDFQKAGHCVAYKHLGDACGGFKECGKLACIEGHCAPFGHPCRGPGRLDQCNP